MARLPLRAAAVAALALTLTGGVLGVGPASAATITTPASALGYDVSFPQCGGSLPTSPGFAVIGVNDGRPYTTNPCLATELQWAGTSLTGAPAFYANTAQPGPTNNTSWPTGQQTPQVCTGGDSPACSYDFGWNAAQQSFQSAVAAETQNGAVSPSSAAAAAPWWLDVETGNSWESTATPSPSATSFLNDQATVQGELAYLSGAGASSVGIYSTATQWAALMGSTGTTFAATAVWLPGFATLAAAQAGCTTTSFTGGRVAMIQFPSGGLDGDYQCPLVSAPVTAMVPVASSATFTQQLSVAGFSAPVTFTQASGTPSLVVSPTGLVTTGGPLAAGSYAASGETADTAGDTGTFTFSLVVTPPPAPKVVTPRATRVIGHAITGATTVVRIVGVGFTGRPVVRSHAGVAALVTADNGRVLTVRVRTAPHTRAGIFTFTITLANHTTLRVRYVQRASGRG